MRMTLLAMTASLGLTGVAFGQSRHSPTPTPPPVTPPVPAPPPLPEKPKPLWEGECIGAVVFLDNKSWRECCLLCSVGDDLPSPTERAAAERDHEKINVTNYFSIAGINRPGRGERDDATASNEGKGKHDDSLRHRYRNGIPSLRSLSPSLGGSDAR
jgi:hypothetical protein